MQFGVENNIMLFLEKLIDGSGNELTIICTKSLTRLPTIEENRQIAGENNELFNILSKSVAIDPDPEQVYKIYFDQYIMYQMRNESFCVLDPDEIRIGEGLILFEKSKLLESLLMFTPVLLEGEDGYPGGAWKHYGIYTADHIIDVISHREPVIEQVDFFE